MSMFMYQKVKPLERIAEYGSWAWVKSNYKPLIALSVLYVMSGAILNYWFGGVGTVFIFWGLLPVLSWVSIFWNSFTKLTFGVVALPELLRLIYMARNEKI